MNSKIKVNLLLFVIVTLLSFGSYLFLPDYFQSLDARVRDFYFRFRGVEKTDKNIIIVDIDEKSIKELGQWPWQRDKIAKILQNLTLDGAGIIGLDIVFSEQDKTSPSLLASKYGFGNMGELEDYDEILSQTISKTPTILGYVFDFDHKNDTQAPQVPIIFLQKHKQKEFLPQAKGVLRNIDIIQDASYSSGFINNIPDSSGMIRSVPLFIEYDMQVYPSLPFEMFRLALGLQKVSIDYGITGVQSVRVGDIDIKTDRFAKLHINFRGPFKSYKYISAVDIYNNKIDKKDIQGKFVLIGTSAYGLMDLRSTPMESVMAGVEIHANILDNLLHQDMLFVPDWAEALNLFVIVFSSMLVIFVFSRFSLVSLFASSALFFMIFLYFYYYMLFTQHIILNIIFTLFTILFSFIGTLGINYMFETRQKEIIKGSFSKKVSKQVMDDLLSHPQATNLTAREVNVSIYFSDIRSFTTISEELSSPQRITDFLNFYMNIMVESIEKYRGTIDKFIGDALMAYWNAPLEVENHADKAVKTALEQILKRDDINKTLKKEFGFEVDYGIGINSGDVVVGEIGSLGRSDYTIIGDAVNLASRLEGLCKYYKVRLVISQYTKMMLRDKYTFQLLDMVKVKGKNQPVEIYEVLGLGEPSDEKKYELKQYEKAHRLYIDMDFKDASEQFGMLYKRYKKYLYRLYEQRSLELFEKNLTSFDGVFEFGTK